jgi:hypothetical protein
MPRRKAKEKKEVKNNGTVHTSINFRNPTPIFLHCATMLS